MGENDRTKNILIIVGVVLAIFLVWHFCIKKDKSTYQKGNQETLKEEFTGLAAGAIDNVGMLDTDNYDLLQGADNEVPAHHFADLVDQGDHLAEYMEPGKEDPVENPMERLERIQGKSLMPRVSTYVTPYNVDVANPASAMYSVNAPRISLKPKGVDRSLANMIRGDIPLSFFANVCLISKTHQGRDDLVMDGLFSPYFHSLYNKQTGATNKNLVQINAGAGQAGGYGGNSGGVIMDFQ
jgi:hypothetical protein